MCFFFVKQKTADELRISDWSSDVCSSDLDVAVLSVSGWMDGGGYMNGAISRYLTLSKNPSHLLLGPWDHGARIDVSPWRTTQMRSDERRVGKECVSKCRCRWSQNH